MAKAVGFEGANKIFRAPPDDPECTDLETFQHDAGIVSCWRLTEEELEEVNKTGVVWLQVFGKGTPPVCVSGLALCQIDGRPARAEPVLPKARLGNAAGD